MKVLPTRWRRKPAGIEITSLSPCVYGREIAYASILTTLFTVSHCWQLWVLNVAGETVCIKLIHYTPQQQQNMNINGHGLVRNVNSRFRHLASKGRHLVDLEK